MKLNRKGITTVEVIVCFILVTVISLSMYSTISAFNNKRIEESYKSKVLVSSSAAAGKTHCSTHGCLFSGKDKKRLSIS